RHHDAGAGPEWSHRIDFRWAGTKTASRRSDQCVEVVPQPSAGTEAAVGAAGTRALSQRSESAAAAAGRESRRRHDGYGWPPASLPALRLQVRGARAQHDSRRCRRGDPQRRADAQRGTAVNVIMKFGGTSVADAEAMMRVINIVRGQIARFPNHTLPIVVVSAMSKVTDRLVETGRLAGQGDGEGAAGLLRD